MRKKYDKCPDGISIEYIDGMMMVTVDESTGITMESFLEATGADARPINDKKSAVVAWLPGLTHPGHVERVNELDAIVQEVFKHLETGAISGDAARSVERLIVWLGEDFHRSNAEQRDRIHGLATAIKSIDTDARRKGGKEKLTKNADARAKADAKAGALELWKERDAGKHPKLRTVEQYATEVMRLWPILESAKVICGWSAQWTKQVKAGKNPVC